MYKMIIALLAGLGVFLFGMRVMSDALQKSAGGKMKRLLEVLTSNKYMGVLVGTVITGIIQSSSATTVMVVGLVNAGMMNLSQAVGVIMGANIGTTATAQLIALFKFKQMIPYTIILGIALLMLAKKKSIKHLGEFFLGFGILFMGMEAMGAAMEPLREMESFQNLMVTLQHNPFLGVLVGVALTAIVQSSSATIGILQTLAFKGMIPLGAALPILFGDNIGTCVTALLASIGTNVTARRAALIHLVFNSIGTLIFLIILKPVMWAVMKTSGDVANQIANTHTLFNIANMLIQIHFTSILIKFVTKVVPGEDKHDKFELKFLDKRILETPSVAAAQIVKEIIRMGEIARENVKRGVEALLNKEEKTIEELYENEKVINELEKQISEYLVMVSNTALGEDERYKITALFNTIHDVERIGDHAENLAEIAEYSIDNKISFSNNAADELRAIFDNVDRALENAFEALRTENGAFVNNVDMYERKVDDLREKFKESHIARLNKNECNVSAGVIFLDALTNLERVSDHCVNIADVVRPGGRKYQQNDSKHEVTVGLI